MPSAYDEIRESSEERKESCSVIADEVESQNEPDVSKCTFLTVIDREAAHHAVSALQSEQQIKRALRHEKNLLLKSKRDQKQEIDEDSVIGVCEVFVSETDDGKAKSDIVECIGNSVDVKSDEGFCEEPSNAIVLDNSNRVRRNAKQSKGCMEIVPVVKDHTYVKQDRKASSSVQEASGRKGNRGKQKQHKPTLVSPRKAPAHGVRGSRERRHLRTRSVVRMPVKEGAIVGPNTPLVKKTVSKQGGTSLPKTSTVVIKADFVLKVPGVPALGQKAFPRKIDLSKILPPVSVHTKRNVLPAATSVSSSKRRSIRKYSKDFLAK